MEIRHNTYQQINGAETHPFIAEIHHYPSTLCTKGCDSTLLQLQQYVEQREANALQKIKLKEVLSSYVLKLISRK